MRRKRNQISAIKDAVDEWIFEEMAIKEHIRNGFEQHEECLVAHQEMHYNVLLTTNMRKSNTKKVRSYKFYIMS